MTTTPWPCSVRETRAAMTEGEFWSDVCSSFVDFDPDEDQPDPPSVRFQDVACELCGAAGPCAYDANGLPLVHTADSGESR